MSKSNNSQIETSQYIAGDGINTAMTLAITRYDLDMKKVINTCTKEWIHPLCTLTNRNNQATK